MAVAVWCRTCALAFLSLFAALAAFRAWWKAPYQQKGSAADAEAENERIHGFAQRVSHAVMESTVGPLLHLTRDTTRSAGS